MSQPLHLLLRVVLFLVAIAVTLSSQPTYGVEQSTSGEFPDFIRLGIARLCQEACVFSCTFSPDGKLVATASHDGTARLWSVADRKELRTLRGHRAQVTSVRFSPTEELLATGSSDGTIRLWDLATGKTIRELKGHPLGVYSIAMSPDGKRLASASGDNTARLWDIRTGKDIHVLRGHTETVHAVAFSPDGKTVATGSADKTLLLWDMQTGREIRRLDSMQDGVHSLAFSPDGRTVVTGSWDTTILLWDVTTGKLVRQFKGTEGPVYSVCLSPDGRTLASGNTDEPARDGKRVNYPVRLWEVATGRQVGIVLGHRNAIWGLCFSPDHRTLASADADGSVALWDITKCNQGRQTEPVDTLWAELAGDNAAAAHRAIWSISGMPERSIPFLATQLKPVRPVELSSVTSLIADLESNKFLVRQRASEKLEEIGDVALTQFNRSIAPGMPLDKRRRLELLLDQAMTWTPERLRLLRAVQALEYIGTSEARSLLAELASGAPDAHQTQAATAAVGRIARQTVAAKR